MFAYAATTFVSAFLLFQIQPLIAKYILPWFGGTSAVWTTCLLFFQVLLLAGYAYAHALTRLHPRRQVSLHLALIVVCLALMGVLALMWQSPILPVAAWMPPTPDFPIVRILALLTVAVGLPYFTLSATGPLIQAWFARTHRAVFPYRLYALSNLGSLLALISYPFIIEPESSVRTQAIVWSVLYVAFAVSISTCAPRLWRAGPAIAAAPDEAGGAQPPAPSLIALWIALPACASITLLATTNRITQDVAPIPLLWILPLALYLVSFIICFDNERRYRRGIFHPLLAIAIGSACVALWFNWGVVAQVTVCSVLLFAICMACHGELVRLRPHHRHLTAFYLMVAAGGALGGIFTAAIAPYVFHGYWEFHLAIGICVLLVVIVLWRDPGSWIHQRRPLLAIGLLAGTLLLPEAVALGARDSHWFRDLASYLAWVAIALALMSAFALRRRDHPDTLNKAALLSASLIVLSMLLAHIRASRSNCLLATRNFYGALTVAAVDRNDPHWHAFALRHGRITHGVQFPELDKRYKPDWYYGTNSGIGVLLLSDTPRGGPVPDRHHLRLGVIGLGIGTLAAYGRAGDYIRFYEINPAVIRIATDPDGWFTYIRDSRAQIDIVPGDARVSMERELAGGRAQNFDVLVVDAFSGDAIPVHLLTREAIQLYLRALTPDGVLAVHISNGYLDLRRVLREAADALHLKYGWVRETPTSKMSGRNDWMLLARNDEVLARPAIAARLQSLDSLPRIRLWTDDYSNLFTILR